MNTISLLAFGVGASSLHALLASFLILVVVLAIVGGLLWCIDRWITPLPPPVRLVIAIIMAILVVLWAIDVFVPV